MNQPRRKQKNWLEWTVFAIGLALVSAVLGYLAQDALRTAAGPAVIEAHAGRPERRGGYYAIPVTVRNRGNQTAEGVLVEAVLDLRDGREERSQFRIEHLPTRSTRRGWVAFTTDPSTARELRLRAVGYTEP